MENSAYASNPLPPPALVVFSQAGGLPEALRMQRPFNPQTPEVKDLHIPFSASSFGLRHMDGYPGLPAHLLHHLQPQFLHPALDPRLPFGSGAFRPLGSEGKGFVSAFAPPSKCLKIETSNGTHEATLFSPGTNAEERNYMNGQQRSDSSSPASVSISPPGLQQVVKEESSDAPMSEDRDGTATPGSVSEGTERSTPEEGRGFRNQNITEVVLLSIDGSLLQELIPSIGHRAAFLSKRNEDVEKVLDRHSHANAVKAFYETNGILSNSCRTAVVDAVISKLFLEARRRGCLDSIKNEHLKVVADKIVDFFPKEKKLESDFNQLHEGHELTIFTTWPQFEDAILKLAASDAKDTYGKFLLQLLRDKTPPLPGRKKLAQDPACCPVCGVTVRAGELESHFLQELDRLFKMSPAGRTRRGHGHNPNAPPRPCGPGNIGSTADGTAEGRWETYQRIKANRTSRLRIKNRKRKADEATCPVCNERFQGSVEELNLHVEHCLRKNGGVPDEDENVDVEGDGETFEEYEWAGQKRIRVSTLLQGGYAGAGMVTSSSRGADDDDSELVVDGDETATYGPPQYSEADVVPPSSDEVERDARDARDALREAVLSPDGRATPRPSSSTTADKDADDKEADKDADKDDQLNMTPPAEGGALANPTLEALKRRIRELEIESKAATADKLKCLICMERYKKPAISICCWHVHCEQCWLHTLGAKKLCPQCNMITSPSDLRRIYL